MHLLKEDREVLLSTRHSFKHVVIQVIVILIMSVDWIHAFNIDLTSPVVYRGTPGSYFGFAVELHREGDENMVLVGAPHGQTNQSGVHMDGAFYKCPVSQEPPVPSTASPSSPCHQIIFDSSGNEMFEGDQIANKSGQMFGATIKSSGPDGTILVCQPLYTWFYHIDSNPNTGRYPVGGCFFASQNFTRILHFNPCKSRDTSMLNYLMCEAGFSATISETEWIIGAIGTFYGQGALLVGNLTSSTYRRTELIDNIALDNNYRGHSVTFGDFFGDGEAEYVTGVPRGTVNHRGLVEFRDRSLHRYLTINGYQIGSYFGHSLVAADFNDDGYDDIVISAPMFTDYNVPITDGWEVGRIHIYYNDEQGRFPVSHTLSGEWPGGRFGFAMTTIGDINRDGYTDLAVSAPYFGEDNEGRVSIFLGTGSRGLSPTPSQHINPSQFGTRMTSFGFSLSGGLDMDNNTYPDLVVGSYLSSAVVLFRSRPVFNLNVTLTLNGSEGIDLNDHNLLLADESKVASFGLSLCFTFAGMAIPEKLNVSYTLSSIDQRPQRSLFFLPNEIANIDSLTQIVTLSKDTALCSHHTGYILNSIRDKLTPITYRLDYQIEANPDDITGDEIKLAPILDFKTQPRKELSIPILNDCNSTICVPDLNILASSDTMEVVVGSSAELHLNVSISNNGEDAYESVLNFTPPTHFNFMQVIQITKTNQPITCDKKIGQQTNSKDLVCDLGNPMVANEEIIMQLVFTTDDVRGDVNNISFLFEASSVHNSSTPSGNTASVNVNVVIGSDVSLQGVSENEYLIYDKKDYEGGINATLLDDQLKPTIIHRYLLRNRGPSDIGSTSVLVRVPYSNSDSTIDRNIVEMIDAEVEGGDKCDLNQVLPTSTAAVDHPLMSTTSRYEHYISTSSSDPTQPSFGRAPARRRRKRRTDIGETNNLTASDYDYVDEDLPTLDCRDQTGCYEITCSIHTVGTRKSSVRDNVVIAVTSRFNIGLFLKLRAEMNTTASVALISNAEVTVYGSNYHVQLNENITLTATATTRIVALQQVLKEDGAESYPYQPAGIAHTSIWMIIGACLMGVAILVGTNAILYKMGFFKRQQIGLEQKVSLRQKPDRMSIRQRSVIFDD